MKYLYAIILFLFPTILSRRIVKALSRGRIQIHKDSRIGFSVILCEDIFLNGSIIGNFNLILCKSLSMDENSYIGIGNIIKGNFKLVMKMSSRINQFNKIVSPLKSENISIFQLGASTHIISSYLFDLTGSIYIDDGTLIAGSGTQLWTHSFNLKNGNREIIINNIRLGKNIYIGSRCIICANVFIVDNSVVGAGSVISKSLEQEGLYCSQPLRYIIPHNNNAYKI